MTKLLVLTTCFDFSGSNYGDTEGYGELTVEQMTDWLRDSDDDLGEVIEQVCSDATCTEIDSDEHRAQIIADLLDGKMVSMPAEQVQVVYAPVVAKEGESARAAKKRTNAEAAAEMKELCTDNSGHAWDEYDEDDEDEDY